MGTACAAEGKYAPPQEHLSSPRLLKKQSQLVGEWITRALPASLPLPASAFLSLPFSPLQAIALRKLIYKAHKTIFDESLLRKLRGEEIHQSHGHVLPQRPQQPITKRLQLTILFVLTFVYVSRCGTH